MTNGRRKRCQNKKVAQLSQASPNHGNKSCAAQLFLTIFSSFEARIAEAISSFK